MVSAVVKLIQDVEVSSNSVTVPGQKERTNVLKKGQLLRAWPVSRDGKTAYTEQPDGWGYHRYLPAGSFEPYNVLEPKAVDFEWLLQALQRRCFYLPNFVPVMSDDAEGMRNLISSIASGGSSGATGVSHVILPPQPGEIRALEHSIWARLFPWYTQAGKLDGRGSILLYAPSYRKGVHPIGGTYSLCAHAYVKVPTGREQRGDHRGYCSKCGLNMSVDSSD